jgi:hypothetical protein
LYYLVLILFVSHISSNAFAANKREFKGISRTITQMAFFKDLQYIIIRNKFLLQQLFAFRTACLDRSTLSCSYLHMKTHVDETKYRDHTSGFM